MRLLGLDLLAYGPFRGLSLDFSAPGLHVVLGRNEAGKSTTLRAITGLFYGIDARTPDAHVHKGPDLRIGGLLEGASGEQVRVVRRKGNANTLLDTRDQPLDEGVMRKLLAGVGRESFVHAFGLTHESLAAGAQALLEGRGDLGESLFDASVGGGGEVQRLVAELRAEAEKLYKPRGATLPLNDAIKSWSDAQKSIREKQSSPEAFLQQERGLEAAIAERQERAKARADLVGRKARLDRARRRLPLEQRHERALHKRTELGAVAEHVERIEAVRERFAGYKHALEQRATIVDEAERLAVRVEDAARRAGVAVGSTDALRLDARTETRVNVLLRDRTRLVAAIEAAKIEIAKQERELARLADVQKSAVAEPTSGARLGVALDRARSLGDVEGRLATKRAQIERRKTELQAKATSDGLFRGALDAYVALRVPSVAAVTRLEATFSEQARDLARIGERLASLEAEAATIERQTAGHAGDFAPPDASALSAARSARDEAWRVLLSATDATRRALELDVERHMREADAVADRMIREADRVTALARLRSEADTNARQREKLEADRDRVNVARSALGAELRALFAEPAIVPPHELAIVEMRAWLERHAEIREASEALREDERELEGEERRRDEVRQELAGALGEDAPERLAELIAVAAQRLSALETARRTSEEAARALAKVRVELDERIAARERDELALAEVQTKLAEVVTPLGVPIDATADEVNRAIEALKDLFAVVDRRAEAENRARALEATTRAFEQDLGRALAELAPDLASLEPRDAAPVLFARADEARANAQEIERLARELEAEGDVVLDDEDRRLLGDRDAADGLLQELEEQIDAVERDVSGLDVRIGGLRSGLEQMKLESNAAEASANAQLHLARVREHTERWCRVRLASHLLSREIERYREENQGPLLSSASLLFARLTLGAFAGIKAGFDEKDRASLKCVRKGGTTEVDVSGLSDGTRDQLYLSLRLASLLRRADLAEPMPLVLDDVLIQLDDQRAAAALAVLAEVARKMQVLFFTHHARLVDIARATVAPAELVVHELASRPTPEPITPSLGA